MLRRSTLLASAVLLTACTGSPVEWTDAAVPMPTAGSGDLLVVDAGERPAWVPEGAPPPTLPPGPRCEGSVRATTVPRGAVRALVAVWWAPRADGSARLLAAESMDGGRSWSATVPVDTLDRGTNGCARPAPAIAADSASGYVHVAYPLWAPEGAGVFFAHTMPGHFMFHTPAVVSYGDQPGEVSVAASGDLVAVAYEDPNARAPRVGLALSRTQGHVFEHRAVETAGAGDAARPRVALRGDRIALAWRRASRADAPGSPAAAEGATMVLLGRLAAAARPTAQASSP